MALDPATRSPATWEVMFPPAPDATARERSRLRRRCRHRLALARYLAPRFEDIHAIGADLPQECIAIMAFAFSSLLFHTTYRVPTYQAWWLASDRRPAYRFHRAFLQHLQAIGGGDRWVLKAPAHIGDLDALLAVYPDAVVIQNHRDPLRVAPSIASHGVVLRSMFAEDVNRFAVAREWRDYWAASIERGLEVRRRSREERFVDVYYRELVADPLRELERVYRQLGWSMSELMRRRVAAYAAGDRQRGSRHRYRLDWFGLSARELRGRFGEYCRSFGVELEEA